MTVSFVRVSCGFGASYFELDYTAGGGASRYYSSVTTASQRPCMKSIGTEYGILRRAALNLPEHDALEVRCITARHKDRLRFATSLLPGRDGALQANSEVREIANTYLPSSHAAV